MKKVLVIDKDIGTIEILSTKDIEHIKHKVSNRNIYIYSYRSNSPLKCRKYNSSTYIWYDI